MIGVVPWKGHRSTGKSYQDNRLISPRAHIDGRGAARVGSSHPGAVVGPKGLGCSPLNVRELGLERRERIRSYQIVGVGVEGAVT